jgi:hypothetical protein
MSFSPVFSPGEGVKQPGSEAHHSPPTSAEAKKTRIYTSTPPRIQDAVLN